MASMCLWTYLEEVKEQEVSSVFVKEQYKMEYIVTLCDEDGKEIEKILYKEEPEVKEISEELLEVSIRAGENNKEVFYFHKKTLQKSDIYINPTLLSKKYVSYWKGKELIVHDIFLEGILYEEIIRDFSMINNPVSHVHLLLCSNETFLILRYKKGKEEEDIREVLKIFPNKKRKAEEVYKEAILEKRDTASRIVKNQYKIEPIGEDYRVYLYDEMGKEVDRIIFPIEPWIKEIGKDLLEVGITSETSERFVFYFHKKTLQKSDIYLNPIVFSEQYIYYTENAKLIIHDIFLEGKLYEEINWDFSPLDRPIGDIYIVPCSNKNILIFEYIKGEDGERVWEVIKISPKKKEDLRRERSENGRKEYQDISLERNSFSIIEKEQCKVERRGEFYIVTLYNETGNKVERILYTKEPEVREIGEELLEVSIRVGERGNKLRKQDEGNFYFHKKTLQMSNIYFNSIVFSEKYVYYMKDNKLIIHDIFLEGILHEEIVRDFSLVEDPVSDVHTFSCSNQDFLIFRYAKGEDKGNIREILEIFPNDERKAEEIFKETILKRGYAIDEKEIDIASVIAKKQYKQYKKERNGEEYIVYLYDEWGKEVDRITYSREPWVREIGRDILEVGVSVGSPARYSFYFHKKTLQQSQEYFNADVLSEKYVSYMDDNKLIVHDIFLEGVLNEEITRDFVGITPVWDIYIFPCSHKTFLIFEYYNGEGYEREAVEIFPKKE